MKRNNVSVLLVVMALFLAMTACVKSDSQVATSEPKIIGTVIEQLPSVPEHVCKVEYLSNCARDEDSPILKMTPEEISDYLAEMVNISKTETLCWSCMKKIGSNFYDIWRLNRSACNKAEFESQAIEAFDNVFAQAVEQQISIDYFNSWEDLPIADILCKFYSSNNYDDFYYVGFPPVDELSEEDLTKVAKVFFANPVFSTNYWFADQVLAKYSDNELADMAWNHLTALSKSTDPELTRDTDTYFTCLHVLGHPENLSNTDRITEIAENILQNSHYNFVSKYVFMCSDFESESDLDKEICDMAFEHLLELAQNADEETYKSILDVAVILYDKYDLDPQVVEDLYNEYNIEALIDCLMSWKEISNTRMPRYY